MSTHHSKIYWQAVACDLDGTLIGRNHKVNDRDLEAIRQARAAGIHIAICTGRNVMESAGVIAALGLSGPGIFVNGGTLCDMASGKSLARRHLPYELALEVIDFLGAMGHAVLILADHPESGRPVYLRTDHGPPHRATVEWLLAHRMESTVVADIPHEFRRHIIRLSIVVDVAGSRETAEAAARHFVERTSTYSIVSPYYDCQVIEIFRAGTSKWSGIVRMCELLEIESSRVIALGDDFNDLEMLEGAALSFAMANADPAVRACAKKMAASQSECGVAQVLESLLRGGLDPQ